MKSDYNITNVAESVQDLSVLDSIFGTSSADVITPVVKTGLENNNLNLDKSLDAALNTEEKKDEVIKVEEKKELATEAVTSALDKTLELVAGAEDDTVTEEKTKGRPSTDKNAVVSYLKKKIEANDFGLPENITYDATKQTLDECLAKLSEDDLHNIIDTNWAAKEAELRAQTPKEFFDSLPEELQYAAAYVAEGGQDLKGLFKALSHVEEVKALDPDKESDQSMIVKSYLQASSKLTDDQINEQVQDWTDAGKLEKKAKEFKPALDDMQKQQVTAHLKQQEEQNKRQQELATFYSQNVYKQLEKNELAGIKLDKKFVRELGDNMVSTVPGPWSGRPVNYLGYGLEKAQYTEPDYEAVMLAAMILNDKPGTLEKIRSQGASAEVDKVRKLIKMNEGLGVAEQVRETQRPVKRIPNNANALKRA